MEQMWHEKDVSLWVINYNKNLVTPKIVYEILFTMMLDGDPIVQPSTVEWR